MKTHQELVEEVEKLEKVIDYILENNLSMPLTISGGGDDGKTQNVPLKTMVRAVLEKLGIKPVFKKEIVFTEVSTNKI